MQRDDEDIAKFDRRHGIDAQRRKRTRARRNAEGTLANEFLDNEADDDDDDHDGDLEEGEIALEETSEANRDISFVEAENETTAGNENVGTENRYYARCIRKSVRDFDQTINILAVGGHACLITSLESLAHTWKCSNCHKLFRSRKLMLRHFATCKPETQKDFVGGGFTPTLLLWERLEMHGYFVPEELKRPNIFTASFDFEAFCCPLETKFLNHDEFPVRRFSEEQLRLPLPADEFIGGCTHELFKNCRIAYDNFPRFCNYFNGVQDYYRFRLIRTNTNYDIQRYLLQCIYRQRCQCSFQIKLHVSDLNSEYREIKMFDKPLKFESFDDVHHLLTKVTRQQMVNRVPRKENGDLWAIMAISFKFLRTKREDTNEMIPFACGIKSNVPFIDPETGERFDETKVFMIENNEEDDDDKVDDAKIMNLIDKFLSYLLRLSEAASQHMRGKWVEIISKLESHCSGIVEDVKRAREMKNELKKLSKDHEFNLQQQLYESSEQKELVYTFLLDKGEAVSSIRAQLYKKREAKRLLDQVLRFTDQTICVGHNSGKFDINLVNKWLFQSLINRKINVGVVKRGNQYMLMATATLRFVDQLNYLADKKSLNSFYAGFGKPPEDWDSDLEELYEVHAQKYPFPYEFFTGPRSLKATQLPDRRQFASKLKGYVDITDEEWELAQKLWSENNCQSMRDYVTIYQKQDVEPFLHCIRNYAVYIWKEVCTYTFMNFLRLIFLGHPLLP